MGVSLIGLTAHFDSSGQKPMSFYLAAVVRFHPQENGSRQFADVGGPEQLVSFAPPFPADYDRVKNADGTLSGSLVLDGFRSFAARVPVPSSRQKQAILILSRRCTVESFLHESKYHLVFDCVELEPGSTSRFEVRLPRNDSGSRSFECQGQSSSAGGWPALLSPILRTNYRCEFSPPATGSDSSGDPTQGQEMLVFAEQSLGAVVRTFHIEHFRPAELTLQAWEQRGLMLAPE